MARQSTIRELFQQRVQDVIDFVTADLRGKIDDPNLELVVIDHHMVLGVVTPWPSRLSWNVALGKSENFCRSCFIGLRRGGDAVRLLAFVKVSRGRVVTSLHFIEKDRQAGFQRGLGMVIMDAVLTGIATSFGSSDISINGPLRQVVRHYKDFGYTTECRKHSQLRLMKAA